MPNLPLLFARRYLFSKKTHSVINVISRVSSLAVAVPVMAMVILLSVFNGFDTLIKSMYQSFDPDIMVIPARGKVFDMGDAPYDRLSGASGVAAVSYLLDDNALFEYRGRQLFGVIRGADSRYGEVVGIDSLIVAGEYRLQFGDFPEACVGQGIAYALGIRTTLYDPLSVFVPRRGKISNMLPYNILRQDDLFPSGIFALESEVDGTYVIAPLDFTQQLLDYEGKASAAAVRIARDASPERVRDNLAAMLGSDFKVLTRYQQNESFYRIMMYEKWGIYFIILLVLVVASFSLVGSLAMLIIDKRRDMQTLIKMGADIGLVRRIFVAEGMLTYLLGGILGLLLGLAVALAQQHFGFVRFGGETFLIDAYPVEVRVSDLCWIVVTFAVVAMGICWLTVRRMISPNELRLD